MFGLKYKLYTLICQYKYNRNKQYLLTR